jgi:HEPN domain-containing protein
MTDIPIAGIEGFAKQRRNVFAHEGFTDGQIERVAYASQASIQLSLRAMLYGLAKNSSTRWRAYR